MSGAREPFEPEAGILVHPAADRRLAVEHWLLSTLPDTARKRARAEWREQGVAMLPLGTLFSTVRIPGQLLIALTATRDAAVLDEFLREAFEGGPVICDPRRNCYYALVPASVPRTWQDAANDWREDGVDVLGRGTIFGVPHVEATSYDPAGRASYWSVLMDSPAMLCAPLLVARLIAAGRECLEAAGE